MEKINVFDLFAKITLDDSGYNEGLDRAASKTKSTGTSLTGSIKSIASGTKSAFSTVADGFEKIENVGKKAADTVGKAAKGLATATAAVASGMAALTTASIQNYAEYEQLVGGVETLFKESADAVQEYAANAYKTAGMSANEYMSTVTSFSASLLQGLDGDTAKAAEIANRAITDMADNANKMGTSIEMIQNAYQGFAKQNYTMLDNLKLGYGGTATEMARLINDSGVLGDAMIDLGDKQNIGAALAEVGFAKMIEAIGVVQDQMGITGTTALEAASTIQGSVASMKSAWANFKVGLADGNQNLELLLDNLVDSVDTVAGNLFPRIEKTVAQIVGIAPKAVDAFLDMAPRFLEVGSNVMKSLADGISSKMPELLRFGSQMIGNLAAGIMEAAPAVIDGITGVFTGAINMIGENSEQLRTVGIRLVNALSYGFSDIVDAVLPLVDDFMPVLIRGFANYHEELFSAGLNIITALVEGLANNTVALFEIGAETLSDYVYGIKENLPRIVEAASEIILALVEGLTIMLPELLPVVVDTINYIVSGIAADLPKIVQAAGDLILALANGIAESLPELVPAIVDVVMKIVDILTNPDSIGQLVDAALAIIVALADGLIDAIPQLVERLPEIIVSIVDTLVDNVPKILAAGVTLLLALAEGLIKAIPDLVSKIPEIITSIVEGFKRYYSQLWEVGKDLVRGIWEGIKSMGSWIGEKVGGFFDGLFSSVKEHEKIHSPSLKWAQIGKFAAQGIGVGWDDEFKQVKSDINKSLDFGVAHMGIEANTNAGMAIPGTNQGVTFSGLTININGANYSDENALAEAISQRLQNMADRRAAVYA